LRFALSHSRTFIPTPNCRFALATPSASPRRWRDHWRAARDACGIAASLSRLFEVGTSSADSRRVARDAFGIAASLSQLFHANPRRGATTGELLAMPSALPLRSHSSFMPTRAVGATTGELLAMPLAFLTPNSSLLTPHSSLLTPHS